MKPEKVGDLARACAAAIGPSLEHEGISFVLVLKDRATGFTTLASSGSHEDALVSLDDCASAIRARRGN